MKNQNPKSKERVFKNVARVQHSKDLSAGLVLNDPKGSHYRIWR
jgi:hypothetical protein